MQSYSEEMLKKAFQFFSQKTIGSKYSSPSDEKVVASFLIILSKEIFDPQFLFNYIAFNWNFRFIVRKESYIAFNWIYGKKAYDRWKQFSNSGGISMNNVEKDLLVKYKITFEDFKRYIGYKTETVVFNYNELHISEEAIKKEFHNTEKGLPNCIQSTTLYNKNSSLCTECNFNVSCKQLLQAEYPIIYQNRNL